MRLHGFGSLLLVSLVSLASARVRADESAPPAPQIEVVVTATRLDDRDVPREDLPASTTVITRDRIEASGARNLQDLLAVEAGVVVFDQVGNDVQKTFDLRGFAAGSGCAVYLDGARVNDPRNNSVALEDVPLDAVERIEVLRGSAAAVAGGGSEAGVVRIFTRRAEIPSGALTLAAGSDAARRYGAELGGSAGRFDGFLSAASDATDGFRTNADGDQKRLAATGGVDFGAGRRLALSVGSSSLDYGNPGALTEEEFASDPASADFNRLDFTSARQRRAALDFRGPLPGGWSIAANLSWISRSSETLSTGRAAAAGFGGFFLDADGATLGSAVQVTHDAASASGAGNHFAAGVEWLDGDTDSLGWFTDPADPASFDRASPSSDNTAGRTTAAVFVHDTWRPSPRWSLSAGARRDADRVSYTERVPDPTLRDRRSFAKSSLRAGAVFHPAPRLDVYASYGESFQPPTVEELFAFPLFGSNRELRPEDAASVELGVRSRGRAVSVEIAAFRTVTRDEIVFDPDAGPGQFGSNVNAGRTLRTGVEASLDGRAGERFRWFSRYTRTAAEFRTGQAKGKRVPLVPADRISAGFDLALPAGVTLRSDATYVGARVLDNDDANAQRELDAYTVVDLRAAWSPGGLRLPTLAGPGRGRGGLTLFVEVRNLFDETYATRGIWAFDFLANANAVFLTPAPGRRVFGGASWRF